MAVFMTMPSAETILERKTMKTLKFYVGSNPALDEDLEDFFQTDYILHRIGETSEI